jgi:hypothetical protein
MKNRQFISILAIGLLAFQACQKSDKNTITTESSLSTNLAAASTEVASATISEATLDDVHGVSVSDLSGLTEKKGGKGSGGFHIPIVSSCATITVSSSSYPKTITIDYGTGCTDHKGLVKKGKIIVTISDTLINAGATETISYENFYIDSIKVELSGTITNLGKNDSSHWVIQKTMAQTITKTDSSKVSETYNETDEWESGFATATRSDDIFYETGSGSINLNDTATYSRTITKALLIDRSCHYIESGTVELNNNGTIVVIDYGDGTCDSTATVTTNGTTEEINLFSGKYRENGKFSKHCRGFGGSGKGWFGFGF